MSNYSLGNIPLIVVTASMSISEESCAKHGHLSMDACVKAHEIWHSLQSDLVTKSTNSKQIRAYNSGHIIQRDEPAVVIEAVRQILGI